jgi:hypothetical protein
MVLNVLLGVYDKVRVKASLVNAPVGQPVASTECANIVPFALGKFDDSKQLSPANNATILTTIH